jgi:hypothetical protein
MYEKAATFNDKVENMVWQVRKSFISFGLECMYVSQSMESKLLVIFPPVR